MPFVKLTCCGISQLFRCDGKIPGPPHVHHLGPAEDGHEGCWSPAGARPALPEEQEGPCHRAQVQD